MKITTISAITIFIMLMACRQNADILIPYRIAPESSVIASQTIKDNWQFILKSSDDLSRLNSRFKGTGLELHYDFFPDSMIIGIVSDEECSISAQLVLDSLKANNNQIFVYPGVTIPAGKMTKEGRPCIFVILENSSKQVIFSETMIHQKHSGPDEVAFQRIMSENRLVRSKYDDPPAVFVIRSEADERHFLDTQETASTFSFPETNYSDSMLVIAKLPWKYSSSVEFEIVSVLRNESFIQVIAQLWSPFYSTPDICAPGDFIQIEKIEGDFELEVLYIH